MTVNYQLVSGKDVPDNLPQVIGLDTEEKMNYPGHMHPTCAELKLVQIATGTENYVIDRDFEALQSKLRGRLCVGLNFQFDLPQLKYHAAISGLKVYDLMIAAGIRDAGAPQDKKLKTHSLQYLVQHYLGRYRDKSIRDEIGRGIIGTRAYEYAAQDAEDSLLLKPYLDNDLDVYQPSEKIFKLEMAVVPALADVVYKGIKLNKTAWIVASRKREARLGEIDLELSKALAGGSRKTFFGEVSAINLNSHAQLRKWLIGVGVDVPSTQRATLEDAMTSYRPQSKQYQALSLLIERSKLQKMVSTYGANWLEYINPMTGRVHTTFFQAKTATGRLSAANPNLTNIPKDPEFRLCFIPARGYVLIKADYSQQEARIMAWVAGEQILIDGFARGDDPYLTVAKMLFHNDNLIKDSKERSIAKTIVLALFYGMGIKSLAYRLGISIPEAEGHMGTFHRMFPKVVAYTESVINSANQKGFSETVWGRRRFGDATSPGFNGEMVNHTIQGTAADMLKTALVMLAKELNGQDAFIVNLVHDEMLVEASLSSYKDIARLVKITMIKAANRIVDVPFDVDVTVGKRWGDRDYAF